MFKLILSDALRLSWHSLMLCVCLVLPMQAFGAAKNSSAPQSPKARNTAEPRPQPPGPYVDAFDLYYGIYVGGQKVGWMHSRLAPGVKTRLDLELRAKVSGMGQASDITLDEHRVYAGQDGLLESLNFVQGSATGRVQMQGRRDGENLHVSIAAGGAAQKLVVPVAEALSDTTALYRLGREGKVGTKVRTVHFDPSIQKVCDVEYTVDAEERRNLAGVETRTVKITAFYPELKVSETSWLDASGKVLESRIGGFFIARLEPADMAKKLDYSQDLLISAVVKAPKALPEAQSIKTLHVSFEGFDGMVPPSDSRQQVQVKGPQTLLTLTQDPAPAAELLGHTPKGKGPEMDAVREALQPTPFIQSGAPALVKAARRAVGSTQDVFEASSRLQHYVFTYLKSEYVPAFSNALEAFNSRRGDCTEHSVLFVALARAAKIPAKVAVGIAYWPPGGGFGWHAWAEIWVDGHWIAVDPTWDQPIADVTHVKLADGGPAEQARIVMLLGQLKITDMQAQP